MCFLRLSKGGNVVMTIKNVGRTWQSEQCLLNCDSTLDRGLESCLSTEGSLTTLNTVSLCRNKIPFIHEMCLNT